MPTRVGEDALKSGLHVFAGDRELTIERVRPHKGRLLASFEGIANASAAEDFVGCDVLAWRDQIVLGTGEYFDDDLVGCSIVQGERTLGTVHAVRHYPAQDILELEGGRFVPLVAEFVREVDVKGKIVRVQLPPGLLEGEPL